MRVPEFFLLATIPLFAALAQADTDHIAFTLLTHNSVVNHYPGADNLIGTEDDVVSGQPAGFGPSDPNTPGALSYFTVRFLGSVATQPEFQGDVVRFVTGGFDVDATGAKGRSFNVVITAGQLNGTVANPFIGRSITTLGEQAGNPDGLSVTFSNNAATGFFDHTTVTPDTMGGPGNFPFPDQEISSATVVVVKKENFGSSGDTYMDNVVSPLVSSELVTGVLRVEFQFVEHQNPNMGLDGAVVQGVLVATTTDPIPQLTPTGGDTPTPTFVMELTPTPTETAVATPSPTLSFTLTPTPQENASPTPTFGSPDLNGDGNVDFRDLLIFIRDWRVPQTMP